MGEGSEQRATGSAAAIPRCGARSRRARLAGILLLALVVRILALAAAWDAEPVHDEVTYVMRGLALLDGAGLEGSFQSWVRHPGHRLEDLPQYPGALQAPGYPAFLAGAMAVGGRSHLAGRVAQVALGMLVVFWVYLLAQRWFGLRQAQIAALICALYPNLIAFSHLLWAETLYLVLLLPALWLLAPRLGAAAVLPTPTESLLAGGLLGAAALTRGSAVTLVPLLVGWLLLAHPGARRAVWGRSALLVLAAALVIAPWTLRNQRIHDGFVLIDTNAAFNLWRGNTARTFQTRGEPSTLHYDWPFESIPVRPVGDIAAAHLVRDAIRATGNERPNDLDITRYARRSALRFIADDPVAFIGRARLKLVDLWNPTSFSMRHFVVEAYGPASTAVRHLTSAAAVLSYLLVMAFAAAGLWLARRQPATWLVLSMVALISGISAVAFGLTRFRLPLLPLLAIFAAHAVVCGLARYRPAPVSR
jgi:4-amino-4-deoxy-L-arabinose transferase-like glycosyltransferase